jgi:hypothetical protein
MQQADRLEQIIRHWAIDTIIELQTIQDNAAWVTLSDGRVFVLKELGPGSAEAVERLHFEYDA